MPLHVLIVPDKFKGSLDAKSVSRAIGQGWKSIRPNDQITHLPMSDGGDGFGSVISNAIEAQPQRTKTVNAAHQTINAHWWWDSTSKTAVVESAKVIGLAILPPKQFHPFQLDTFGLGKLLLAAKKKGARNYLIGIGGSATNDGGFGLARSLGWKFLSLQGKELTSWYDLDKLTDVRRPTVPLVFENLTVAVDVTNPLLGRTGCSAVYGPQKGLSANDIAVADARLAKLAQVLKRNCGLDFAKTPGAGAAGGLGFGLMSFLNATPQPGFEIFSSSSQLKKKMQQADLVITGEGAIDEQTLMGKGVGQIAKMAKSIGIPCFAIAGMVMDVARSNRLFSNSRALCDITTLENAKRSPSVYLKKIAADLARQHTARASS